MLSDTTVPRSVLWILVPVVMGLLLGVLISSFRCVHGGQGAGYYFAQLARRFDVLVFTTGGAEAQGAQLFARIVCYFGELLLGAAVVWGLLGHVSGCGIRLWPSEA